MADHVYFNISIPYKEAQREGCNAELSYESSSPIIGDASQYYVSLINFSFPVSTTPLSILDVDPYPNTDINQLIYKVAIEYNGEVITRSVMFYTTDTTVLLPPAPSITCPTPKRTLYYSIYTYTHFLDMINKALDDAYNALAVKPGGGIAPKIAFDPTANRFKIIANSTYETALANPVKMYLSYELFTFFIGFHFIKVGAQTADARDYLVQFLDNTGIVEQDYSTISNWNALRRIQLKSSELMTRGEYTPAVGSGSSANDGTQSVLASFNPISSNAVNGAVARSQITYSLEGANRLIDLVSTKPLTTIGLQIDFCDEKNNCYPLKMNYRDLVQCKIVFHRKEAYRG